MVELIALYIVCRNVGAIARSRGARARPYQVRAVVSWIVGELGIACLAGYVGLGGAGVYLGALLGAFGSLPFSFAAARAAPPAIRRANKVDKTKGNATAGDRVGPA